MKKFIFYFGIFTLGAIEVFLIYRWITIDNGGYEPIYTIVSSILLPIYIFFGNKIIDNKRVKEEERMVNLVLSAIDSGKQELLSSIKSFHQSTTEAIEKLEKEKRMKNSPPINSEALDDLKVGKIGKSIKAFQSILSKEEGNYQNKQASQTARYLGAFLLGKDPSKSIDYFERSISLNSDNIDAFAEYGIALMILGHTQKAFNIFEIAKKKVIETNQLSYALILTNIGVLYSNQGNFRRAIECQEEALEIHKNYKHEKGIAANLSNLGVVYWEQNRGQFEIAKEMFEKSIKIESKLNNLFGLACDYECLGVAYMTQGHLQKKTQFFDLAESYISKAIEINKEIPHLIRLSRNYGNLGMVYSNKSDFLDNGSEEFIEFIKKADKYVTKALKLSQEINFLEGEANQYSNLGVLEEEKRNNTKAIEYWELALDIYVKIGMGHKVNDLQRWISNV